MSALPGQSLDSYRSTLRKLLKLEPIPEHISAYSLIVEEGTVFAKWEAEGKLVLPDEDCEREMYEETKRILGEAGFQRYEISNYARKGYECRHNCGYWKRVDYLGFGIGAASLIKNCRFQNDSDLHRYLENPLDCRIDFQELSREEQMEETMFLGLRMTDGVSCEEFQTHFGRNMEDVYGAVISQNRKDGLLFYLKEDGKPVSLSEDEGNLQEVQKVSGIRLALTEKGLDVSNYVMSQFLFD